MAHPLSRERHTPMLTLSPSWLRMDPAGDGSRPAALPCGELRVSRDHRPFLLATDYLADYNCHTEVTLMKEVLLSVHIEALPEGGFLATSDELPGMVAQGRTVAETVEIAQDVARKLIESFLEHGDELPPGLRNAMPPSGDVHIPVSVS